MNLLKWFSSKANAPEPNMKRQAVVSSQYEPVNVSSNATASSVQAAIRAAEGGNTRELFALYRDMVLGDDHIQAEFNKRKLAVLAQPHAILPEDKTKDEDLQAAQAVVLMIKNCENWSKGLGHFLDGTLWPLAVGEKIFRPVAAAELGTIKLQFTLRQLAPVNPTLFCFRQPYGQQANVKELAMQWEPDLRFYSTDEYGAIIWNYEQTYGADLMRHIVHRGHLQTVVRDNWGGPMRALLGWWLLSILGRDWFGRFMERFGNPFIVARTDSQDKEAVTFLEEALKMTTKIGGMVVDDETAIELKEAMLSGGADAYERFLSICNRAKSKIILGQTLSAEAQSTGLGSSVGKLQGEVREDIRMFDQLQLGETLQKQLFEPFLRINGLRGAAPKIVWGGLSDEDAKTFAELLKVLKDAGWEPTDDAISTLNERMGFPVQRVAAPEFIPGGAPSGRALPFSAMIPKPTHPSDVIAAKKAAALAQAFRGAYAPVRMIILSSATPEEAERKLAAFYLDWKPERVHQVMEEALQICAAAGAVDIK